MFLILARRELNEARECGQRAGTIMEVFTFKERPVSFLR